MTNLFKDNSKNANLLMDLTPWMRDWWLVRTAFAVKHL